MSNLYAMRRANGDWFAFEEPGHLRMPLFSSGHKAMQARQHNWGMLLFKPVIFDERALNELAPTGEETGVHFWLAGGSSTKLGHGQLIDHAQLALLMHEPVEQPSV
ncbi:MAG TPA: hypothetical protein VF779_13275 [Pyrinomonadaceae bacterium]